MRDPYSVLGVSKTADAQTVRKAYKRLAREHHPDRNPDQHAAERFKEIVEAYAILTSDKERERYVRQRRREHDEQQQRRKQQAAETRRRRAEQQSETVAAAEEAFRAYARQVQARRAQREASATRQGSSPVRGQTGGGETPATRLGSLVAVGTMLVYYWRSWHGLPLQPMMPGDGRFDVHLLGSPIWITLWLALLLIVRPKLFLVPFIVEGPRDIRLFGWFLLLVCPFVAGGPLGLL